jgi:hypothetical protein
VAITERNPKKTADRPAARRPWVKPVVVGVIVMGLGLAAWEVFGGSGGEPQIGTTPTRVYFTDDDGKTVFPDDAAKLPPFDHNGKPAVKANCFTSDGGRTHWVAYLERFTPAGKRAMEEFNRRKPQDQDPIDRTRLMGMAVEVKPPGAPEGEWVSISSKKYTGVVTPKPPAGASGQIWPYMP